MTEAARVEGTALELLGVASKIGWSFDLEAGVSETPLGRTGLNFWVGFAPMHNSAQQTVQTAITQSRRDLMVRNLVTVSQEAQTLVW